MAFRLEFAIEVERDFWLIFDHPLRSYLEFGESPENATPLPTLPPARG